MIKQHYPNNHYELYPNQWLVSGGVTAQELSEKLGIDKETNGSGPALVLSISSYWGMANPNIWEWLKVNWEKSVG